MGLGNRCKVTTRDNASKRTKERIHQHGPNFTVSRIDIDNNKIMLRSDDGWFGWIPSNEIKVDMLRG